MLLGAAALGACNPGRLPDPERIRALAAITESLLTPSTLKGRASPDTGVAVIGEHFLTPSSRKDNLDSPAVWHAPDDMRWLIVTAKSTDLIIVYDGDDGRLLGRFGGKGSEPGQLRRPNGVAVVEDLAFVVERDNRRVQVFSLPRFEPLLTFGTDVLRRPYGIAAFVASAGTDIEVYVTDDHAGGPEERVKHFRLQHAGSALDPTFVQSFGARSGRGVLQKVESIAADPSHGRLLIADEQARDIKVYTLAGAYTGITFGKAFFRHEPEGLALYSCGSAGYWITTEQNRNRSTFHVLDRLTFEYVGAFRGRTIANTDGVALSQGHPGSDLPAIFYAVHDDRAVGALAWSHIARALGLRGDCSTD